MDISENTRIEYKYRINSYVLFIRMNGFTMNSYLEYKQYLSERTDYSISTKNKYLIVARVYCKKLHREGLLPIGITQNIKSFQQSRKHKRDGLIEAEVQKILTHIHNLSYDPATCRINTLLSLLILQGLRQIEIIRLNVNVLILLHKLWLN